MRRGCPDPGRFTEVMPVATTAKRIQGERFLWKNWGKRHTTQPCAPGRAVLSEPASASGLCANQGRSDYRLGEAGRDFQPSTDPAGQSTASLGWWASQKCGSKTRSSKHQSYTEVG